MMDGQKVIKGLKAKGFCDGSGKPLPQFKWIRLPQSEINGKINSILRGLSEWWKYAGNRRSMLSMASFILRFSAAKLYAAKFKLGTVAAVFKRCGRELSKPVSSKRKAITGVDGSTVAFAKAKAKAKVIESWAESLTGKAVPKRKMPSILFTHYWETPRMANYPRNYRPTHEKLVQEKQLDKLAELLITEKREPTNPLDIPFWRLARSVRALKAPFPAGTNASRPLSRPYGKHECNRQTRKTNLS
jgi:hypothetical protein